MSRRKVIDMGHIVAGEADGEFSLPDPVKTPANGSPKFKTVEETIAAMRDIATRYAAKLGAPPYKLSQGSAYAKLIGICTAIEMVTVNGNYYSEMTDAIRRAQEAKTA
jgi:hypothetical protein